MTAGSEARGPLSGLKVLEMGQLIAGPFAAKTLGDFGADVDQDRAARQPAIRCASGGC
jgi:crotonobetainyl-CoA:carnitine CoA-transferase CaiB-like acyl-CoA transferase